MKTTEPNQSLQTISCSVTVAAEPLCVPPHEMSDLKRSANMNKKKSPKVHRIPFYSDAVRERIEERKRVKFKARFEKRMAEIEVREALKIKNKGKKAWAPTYQGGAPGLIQQK